MDLGLTGKKVLITGANGNIGRAIVTKFFQENAITLIHYRKDDDRIQKLKENFNQDWFFKADLTCEEEVKKMFSQIEEKFGAIDIVVANAGFWNPNSKMIAI
jgi:3-oxoacyl-[acyl-carrier protein] reductase